MSRLDSYGYFKPSVPRKAKGGIKAQSKRGTFGESWWAKRWIVVLESFNIGARLGRGRSYARSGQVLSVEIDKGKVRAKVQGSRPKPYDIKMEIKTLSSDSWQKLAKAFSNQAIFAAKLLAGEMPEDIEKAFKGAGLSLFPEKLKDLETNCSCPDWSNPCKHIAAVYYLLGEEFDRDPFLIFKLRGMNREELLEILGGVSKKADKGRSKRKPTSIPEKEKDILLSEPLCADVSIFWNGSSLPEDFLGEVRVPPVPAALLKRLGNFPFWRGKERFFEALEAVYVRSSTHGLDVFLGERRNLDSPDDKNHS